jgi:outer membrane protein
MKSKIICICIAFLSTIAVAQTKVGTVDSEYIMNLMPETKIVLKRSQTYATKLDSSFTIKVTEYEDKLSDFNKNEKTILPLAKRTAIQELTDLEANLKKYQENGQKLMQLKREELMRPLYKKLNEAIELVAKGGNYTQILTVTGNQFAYIDNKFDITELVIKSLGIKIPESGK